MSKKLIDISAVCPYTGLRSFTEDESLYFKGRDGQLDQLISQLEERKFLMLTGASGEGKSSLIYAGLIPQARAGFFKAQYSNWTVVDFRPERSPVATMASVLADRFSLSASTIETEMRRGFSSLTDLYLNSEFYVGEKENDHLPDGERKIRLRKASNLLILIDQFEEFFTNPENYYNENPSQDSQVVVNLILETARIALDQKLPIYVVCTMRSDYIGQCSAFRGLPEFIGYSQFFVPRLRRNELRQVIEEPAVLSGNQISRRLTERLIYDLSEGVDQLPILQHALSQIWLMANHGEEEMDLIHYAMVGGMPAKELPVADLARFELWYNALAPEHHKFYAETGLNKVIEMHASKLYEDAADAYNALYEDQITRRDAKVAIALAFACLTGIDNSRAVRNRMTLQEITAIINRPDLPVEKVGRIIDIFRLSKNSFVRPFKNQTGSSTDLTGNTVLDITHESLIRNWGMLNKWANQEHEFHATFLDLTKQLERWKENGKSQSYLLPIGPLTYFESWYQQCKPNTAWINRYMDKGDNAPDSWKRSEALLSEAREFLSKSARNVAISRFFIKYGAGKIAAVTIAIVLVAIAGFFLYDTSQKKDQVVLQKVQDEAHGLLSSLEVSGTTKAMYLLSEERYAVGSVMLNVRSNTDVKTRFTLAMDTYRQLLIVDNHNKQKFKFDLIQQISNDITSSAEIHRNDQARLVDFNAFIVVLAADQYFNPDPLVETTLQRMASELYEPLVAILKSKDGAVNIMTFNQAMHFWLTFGKPSAGNLENLIALIDPTSSTDAKLRFERIYPNGNFEPNGLKGLAYNGGLHVLASLYAALGEASKIIWCFDQQRDQTDYFTDNVFNSSSNVLGYLYQFGHRDKVPEVVSWINGKFPNVRIETVYRDLLVRSGYISHLYRVNLGDDRRPDTEEGNLHVNLFFSSRHQFKAIADDYLAALEQIPDENERAFLTALHYKRIGMFEHRYHVDRSLSVSQQYLDELFEKAWSNFTKLNAEEQQRKTSVSYYYTREVRIMELTRRQLFIYPDYIGGWMAGTYHGDIFFDYLDRKKLLDEAFRTPQDMDQIHHWLANILANRRLQPADATLLRLADFGQNRKDQRNTNMSIPLMILSSRAFENNDTTKATAYYNRLKSYSIGRSINENNSWEKTYFLNALMRFCGNMAKAGKTKAAIGFLENFNPLTAKIIGFAHCAGRISESNKNTSAAIFLDSALTQMKKVENSLVPWFLEYRDDLTYAFSRLGDDKTPAAKAIFRNIPEARKFIAVRSKIEGIVDRGDFYSARDAIPATLTEEQDLLCRTVIILKAAKLREEKANEKGWNALDNYVQQQKFIFFGGFL